MNLECHLIAHSDAEHLRQIYTGFSLLHHRGFLHLKQTIPAEFTGNKNDSGRWVDYKFFNAKVVINNKITVVYDAHDWNWIDEEILGEADFYFKRSYDEQYVERLADKRKVFPLGLNYQVSSDQRDVFQMQRAAFYGGKDKIKALLKSLNIGKLRSTERLDKLNAYPDFDAPPKILFMTRVWDTDKIEGKSQTKLVEQLNETRAECVRILRKHFGERFFGGLAHENFAVEHYKDCLLPDAALSNKRKYLELLKNYPICVTTAGLNGSNGWKLGEYVAFSKAIVTEPLQFAVTGDFADGKNYLEFTTPDRLIETTELLFQDKNRRAAMMLDNYRYYQNFVRPDALVLNSLAVVFSRTEHRILN